MEQQKLIQMQVIEQETNQLEQQLRLIEHHFAELQQLKQGLNELENSKNKDILANIGKGVYIPAEIKSKELIIEVGKNLFVKKNISETNRIIDEQRERLNSVKQQIMERIEMLQSQINSLIQNKN